MKYRLDQLLYARGLVSSRSQAENWIRLGHVRVNGESIHKPGYFANDSDAVELVDARQYVSRGALKLESVAKSLGLDFAGKILLDVGSSTGGFTDYALQHSARKVIAVDVGTEQLHQNLRNDPRIELHEQTDIRDIQELSATPDLVVVDVSFISLRLVLPHIAALSNRRTRIIAMVKPQFEAQSDNLKHKGVIKNDHIRRDILKNFEQWAASHFIVIAKADSQISGAKGNLERFYELRILT